MTTTTKLLGVTAITALIYHFGGKKFGQEKATAAAVVYGLVAGAYVAKSR
jgi:4-amino-4-deoxy-L-arabinose transferase-like glycosyltransferase